jgi:selenocysteine-specific translation elongation factor
MIIVLNKIDMIPIDKRKEKIEKTKISLMKNVFSKTKFKDSPIVAISCNPKDEEPIGLDELKNEIEKFSEIGIKKDYINEDLLFSVDHCFLIKGKGNF